MELIVFYIFVGLILATIFLGTGVLIGGCYMDSDNKPDSDSNNNMGASDSENDNREELDRSPIRMDAETATIALGLVKHDLENVLSPKEIKSIDYAIECIEIREKVETWLEEREKEITHRSTSGT